MLNRLSKLLGAFVGIGSLAVLANACGEDCAVSNTCGGAIADSGPIGPDADSGGDVIEPPVGCDAEAEPKDSAACVVDGYGVFVDATSGNDANAGTKAQPVKTIGGALMKLGGKPRVYVCDGTYAEHVKVPAAVSIYGGFACGAWTYSGVKAKVEPADAGYALQIEKVSDGLVIADVSFRALAGTEASPSSIAAFVNASPKVSMRRVELVARKGAGGKSPAKAADGALMSATPMAGTLNGNTGSATVGGFAQLCTCVGGGTSKGGGGGNINSDGSPGEVVQTPSTPATATGEAGRLADCTAGTGSYVNGRPGSDAPPAAGASGATKLGTLTEGGWTSELGANGGAGTPGQGGGGGGGSSGGGGGGACGGCGGSAGEGGGGGGSSVALLALNSPVSLAQCILTTADAGAGGAGGAGGDGLAGGTRGTAGGAACNGGNGGKGGAGGAGGGGAGGVSVGVLYKGAKPAVDASVTTGAKGSAGPGAAGNDGIEGQKAATLEVQ